MINIPTNADKCAIMYGIPGVGKNELTKSIKRTYEVEGKRL